MSKIENEDFERVKKHVDELREFFDTVQVFTTRYVPEEKNGGTRQITYGEGNWFARYGQVHEWMIREDESARGDRRKWDECEEK